MSRRHVGPLAAILLVLAACGSVDQGGSVASHELLAVRVGSGSWQDLLLTVDSGDGVVQQELPIGTPSPDWSTIYTATASGERTTVRALSTATGDERAAVHLDGAFSLPPVGSEGLPGGLSQDGRRLVLEAEPHDGVSRFAVLEAASLDLSSEIILPGSFTYDVLSPDGSVLYLLEYLEQDRAGRYQVRAFDIGLDRLREQVVVDKVTLQSAMEGHPVAQLLGRDGRIAYTVYHNHHHGPFIHALNTTDGTAICIDLPKEGRESHAAGRYWGLALSSDGRTLFAANGALGLAAAIDTAEEKVVDTSAVGAASPIDDIVGGAGPMLGAVALSPDAQSLYAAGPNGVAVIDAATLEGRERYLVGTDVSSVAASEDGDRLYVAAHGAINVLEATTGEHVGELIEAEQPYGVVATSPET